jgi:hypothetical protein
LWICADACKDCARNAMHSFKPAAFKVYSCACAPFSKFLGSTPAWPVAHPGVGTSQEGPGRRLCCWHLRLWSACPCKCSIQHLSTVEHDCQGLLLTQLWSKAFDEVLVARTAELGTTTRRLVFLRWRCTVSNACAAAHLGQG